MLDHVNKGLKSANDRICADLGGGTASPWPPHLLGCCNPLKIINTEGHITVNLLPVTVQIWTSSFH